MASLNYYLKQNTSSTATEAPYTIQVVPNGVYAGDDFLAEVAKDCPLSVGNLKTILEAIKSVCKSKCAEGYTVDANFMKVSPKVYGTVDYIDVPFTSTLQSYEVQTFNSTGLSGATDDLIPVRISADEIAASIRICNVMDVASETFGVLDGVKDAILTGNGITMDQTGEYIKLLDKKTLEVKATCVIGTCNKGQRVKFHLPATAAIPVGDYYLEIATKGLVALEQPNIYRKPVKLISAVAPAGPTLTSEYATLFGPTEGNGEMLGGEETNVTIGTNLANATKLVFHYYDGEEENNDEMIIVSKTDTQITFKLPESVLAGINGHLIVTTPNGTHTSSFVCQKLEG